MLISLVEEGDEDDVEEDDVEDDVEEDDGWWTWTVMDCDGSHSMWMMLVHVMTFLTWMECHSSMWIAMTMLLQHSIPTHSTMMMMMIPTWKPTMWRLNSSMVLLNSMVLLIV